MTRWRGKNSSCPALYFRYYVPYCSMFGKYEWGEGGGTSFHMVSRKPKKMVCAESSRYNELLSVSLLLLPNAVWTILEQNEIQETKKRGEWGGGGGGGRREFDFFLFSKERKNGNEAGHLSSSAAADWNNHGEEGASCATMWTAAKCATEARIVAAWKILKWKVKWRVFF